MEDLQVIIKLSEFKEFEAKIAEAKTKDEQHKATLLELAQLNKDLGGRKENVIRVEKHTVHTFRPSDRFAREVATAVTNNAFEKLDELGRYTGYFKQTFVEALLPKVLHSINFCIDIYGYDDEFSEEDRLEVMDLEKGSQEALEVMEARVEKLKAELKEVEAECYKALSEAAARTRDLHALRLEIACMQEENESLKATVQKLRDELREAIQPTKEEGKSFLNKLINKL